MEMLDIWGRAWSPGVSGGSGYRGRWEDLEIGGEAARFEFARDVFAFVPFDADRITERRRSRFARSLAG